MHRLIRRAFVAVSAAAVLIVAVAGGASASETTVLADRASTSGAPVLGWSPVTSAGTYSYGTLNPGQHVSRVFTLTNSGAGATAALKVTLTGSAAFTKTRNTCTGQVVQPNGSCTITVRYAPAANGQNDSTTLTATSRKPGAVASLALQGASVKASPVIATAPSAGGAVGTAVTDTAALAGGDNPAGTIEFTLYGPSTAANCTGTPVFDQTVTVSGDGSYASPSFTPTLAGTYWWTARYSGDTSNNPVASGCDQEPVTVSKTAAVLATAPSATGTGLVSATAVTDTAALAGTYNSAGTIEFTLYGPSTAANCTGTAVFDQTVAVSGDGSYASPSFTPTEAGTYWWMASYSGDANNNPATTNCGDESVTIGKVSPAISAAPGPGGPAPATTVTDTAALAGSYSATGTITFTLYGPSTTASCTGSPADDETATVSGDGTYATPAGATPPQPGTYWWVASYSGDANNNPATTNCGGESVTISDGAPAITDQHTDEGPPGTTMTNTATLTGGASPTGTIEFKLYGPVALGYPLCANNLLVDDETATVTGDGTYATPAGASLSQPGAYYWTISYSGDASNDPVTTPCGQELAIINASPTITSTPSVGGPPGTTVTDSAAMAGASYPANWSEVEFGLYGPSATPNCSGTPVDTEYMNADQGQFYHNDYYYYTQTGATLRQPGTYWWVVSYTGDFVNNPATTTCGDESVTITP